MEDIYKILIILAAGVLGGLLCYKTLIKNHITEEQKMAQERNMLKRQALRELEGKKEDNFYSRISEFFPFLNWKQTYGPKLLQAGQYDAEPSTWGGFSLFAGIVLGSVSAILLPMEGVMQKIALFILFFIAGSYIPMSKLKKMAMSRQIQINRELSDAIDMMVSICETGSSFYAGMKHVAVSMKKVTPVVADEFERTVNDISLGMSEEEALKSLKNRCQNQQVSNFVNSILEAKKSGGSITGVLREQSRNLRIAKRLAIEQEIQMLPSKLTPIIATCMMPLSVILNLIPVLVMAYKSIVNVV